MPAGFDPAYRVTDFYAAFARVKQFLADFRAKETFCPSVARRCDGLVGQIDALVYALYAVTLAEIKILEGEAK